MVANGNQPYIKFAVNWLANFLWRSTDTHWHSVIHILQYTNTPPSLCLNLRTDKGEIIHGFLDADWGLTSEDRRLTTGWIFKYGGGAVSWKLSQQPTVALLSTEEEYLEMSDVACEDLWLKGRAADLGVVEKPTKIYIVNLGAGELLESDISHLHTKSIDTRHHFIKDSIASKELEIQYKPTGDMLVDLYTKALGRPKHLAVVKILAMV